MTINRDINQLTPNFKIKVELFLQEAKQNGLDIFVFEGLRLKQRQAELYAQGRTKPGKKVTWTLKSKHLEGNAIDVVFDSNSDPKVQAPSWNGNYQKLIEIGKKYGMKNLAPAEVCHFEDDGTIYILTIEDIMNKYTELANSEIKKLGEKLYLSEMDSTNPITEGDVRALLNVGLARVHKQFKDDLVVFYNGIKKEFKK